MRSDIFIEWLNYLDNYFRIMNRKILLLIDNAGSHFNPKVLEETNSNLNENDFDGEDDEVAESSHSAQSRKKAKKRQQKKDLILGLLILRLFIFSQILQHICNLWMQALSTVSKLDIKGNFAII